MNSRWKNTMIGLFHFFVVNRSEREQGQKRYAGNKENFQEICE